MEITKQFAEDFARSAEAVLRVLAENHGLEVRSRGGNYTSSTLLEKFEFYTKDEKGIELTREAATFKWYVAAYPNCGLVEKDLGKTFTSRSIAYKLTGLNSKRSRFPFCAMRVSDGKNFKFSEESIKRAFAK